MTKAMFAQGTNVLSFNLQPTILGHFHTGVLFLKIKSGIVVISTGLCGGVKVSAHLEI